MAHISIIVPVYKAENVLERAVDSVLAQTYQDWELILINDGSPDGSGALCDQYAKDDARIRVIHKENGGVSTARNLGMAEAQGMYILFLDSDDWFEPNMAETLMTALVKEGADSAGCGHWNIQVSGEKIAEPSAVPVGVYDKAGIRTGVVNRLLGQRLGENEPVLNGFIWRFLFSKSIIQANAIQFEGAYLEDELFLMEYFSYSEKLVTVDEPLYYYLQNPQSVTHNYLPDYMETFERFMELKVLLVEKFHLAGEDLQWENSSRWAGLLIAVGNEYAKSNPKSLKEKTATVKGLAQESKTVQVMKELRPSGMGRNKQLVADLLRCKQYWLLSLLYWVKNR